MKVNGVAFKTYLLDNSTSVHERIALEMGVLPKYLHFNPVIDGKISIMSDIDIAVTNIIQPFIKCTTLVFPSNLLPVNISRKEVEELFIIYHEVLNEQPQLCLLLENLITNNVDFVWNNRNQLKNKLKDEFEKLRKQVESHTRACKEFEKIQPVESLDYDETHVRLNVYIDSPADISEIFNSILTSYQVPYAKYNKFYKILHNFQLCKSWLEYEIDGGIFLKVDSEIQEYSSEYITQLTEFGSHCEYNHNIQSLKSVRFFQRYTNAAIAKIKHNDKDCILLTVDVIVGEKNTPREIVFLKLFKAINCFAEQDILFVEEKSSTGIVIYPSQTLLIPIWADMCMTNIYFSNIVVIDESIRASKKRENVYMYVVDETTDIITIAMKPTTKPGMYTMLTENTLYLRARIKAKTSSEARRYKEIIARFITIYNSEYAKILDIYRYFIPGFLVENITKFSTIKPNEDFLRLKDIAPDIFLSNYSRECFKRPTIVPEEEALELMKTGEKQVMPFPVFGEAVKRYYVCNHETHPYPGLRTNKLENKHKFPYIPCCYIKNQDREGTKLRHYCVQTGVKEQQTAIQDIFLSNKILPPGMSGVLPENIKQLFSVINPDPRFKFVRFGINNNYNALLETIMLALNYNNLQFITPEERKVVVEQQREILNNNADIYAVSAKQELYDYPTEDIATRIRKEKLNALEFFHVMEQFFDCSVFIFTSNDKNPNGTLAIPPHSQIHVKAIPIRPTVFIYQQNKMNESHCELIVKTTVGQPKTLEYMTTVFTFNDYVVQQVWDIFNNINRAFTRSGLITPVMLPFVKGSTITKNETKFVLRVTSQYIDVYGKTRMLTIKTNDNKLLSLMCDPVAPYAAAVDTTIHRASVDLIIQIVQRFKATIVEHRFNGDICREIVVVMPSLSVQDPRYLKHRITNQPVDGIQVTFLCNEKTTLKNINKNTNPKYDNVFVFEKTPLVLYDVNRKIAKLLIHHALFLFSTFLYKNNLQPTDHQLALWVNKKTIIDLQHFTKASNIYNTQQDSLDFIRFDKTNPFIRVLENNKYLIIPSNESRLRLAYIMRLYMNTNKSKLVSFYKNISINDFYSEISDFSTHPNQFVFEDIKAVSYMLESYKSDLYITKTLKIEAKEPYFIYTSIAPKQIFIARNVITKQAALKDHRGRPTKSDYFADDDFDSPEYIEDEVENEAPTKKTKKYKMIEFVDRYKPLQVAIYIVRFWNVYKYNPTPQELILAAENGNLEEGEVDIYSWINYQNVTNLTNFKTPLSSFVFGYKVDQKPRYTAVMKI